MNYVAALPVRYGRLADTAAGDIFPDRGCLMRKICGLPLVLVRVRYRGRIDRGFVSVMERITVTADDIGIDKRVLDIDSGGGRDDGGARPRISCPSSIPW